MVGYIKESKGGDFTPTPEGQHTMICVSIIDLGTQETEFNGEKKSQRKISIGWEVQGERTVVNNESVPLIHRERYTWSFHEKANLRKHLEAWRGKKFVEQDFRGPPNGFHIKNVLGVPCIAQIMHEASSNGKTYANISSLMRHPSGPNDRPTPETTPVFFDLDNFDNAVYMALPDYWREVISKSQEYQNITSAGHVNNGYHYQSGYQQGHATPYEDEIGF